MPYLGDERPARSLFLPRTLPGRALLPQHSTLPIYLALMRFIAPKQPTARARLLTALVFCSSLRYFLLVRFAYLFFGDLWPVTPILIVLL